MKIWTGHGSEHSYNLVMIGYFADETQARGAEQRFQRLSEVAASQLPEPNWDSDQRFTTGLLEILNELKAWDLGRSDIENFAYDHTVHRKGKELHIETDEGEVQGFLKVLIDSGARIMVYSAHRWTAEGELRAEDTEEESGGKTEG
jgi:hypothetical protein